MPTALRMCARHSMYSMKCSAVLSRTTVLVAHLPAARCGCVTASTMGSDAEAKAERRGCCYGGVCRWMARHRLACLLLVLCGGAVFGIVVDRDRNLWWLLAAVTGGLPVARFVVWLLLHFVKQALPDVLLW